MRLIDADVFVHNVVKYSHQSTKTIGQALADTPTVDAIPKSVIEDIKADLRMIDASMVYKVWSCEEIIRFIDRHIGKENDLGDYPDAIPNQFDNMTGSMNL